MSEKKYIVLYIGSPPGKITSFDKWGGSVATSYAFKESFKNHSKYDVILVNKRELNTAEDIKKIIEENEHDILHVDDTQILELMYENNMSAPDVIGPITRSPIKPYKDRRPNYDENYFYNSAIIRLNRSEEYIKKEDIDYTDKIIYINHGIDTDLLLPSIENKNIILWAGDRGRAAKGFDMWQNILSMVKLPAGYRFMTLNNYTIENYWIILDYVKIIVNTSLNESFCCAMFEAKSKAIPSIYKKDLHNGRHEDGRIQVEYTIEAYEEEIIKLLTDKEYYEKEATMSRKYTVDNFSLKRMAETYSNVYDLVLERKINKL